MFEDSVSSVPSIWASMNSWFTPTVLFVFLNLMIGTIFITSRLAANKHNEQEDYKQVQAQLQTQQLPRSPSVLQRLKSINIYSYRCQESTTLTFEKPQEFDHHFSNLQHTHQQEYYQQDQPTLSRSPSMLQRLKSINLYNYLSQEPITTTIHKTQETRTPQQIHDLKGEQEQHQEQNEEEEKEVGGEENDQIQDQEQTLDEIYSKLQGIKVSRSKSDTKPTSGEVPTKLTKKMKKSASLKSAFAHFEEEDIVESRRPATVKERKTTMTEVDDAEVDAKADDFIHKFKQQLKLQRMDSIIRYKEMINRGSEK